MTSGPVKTEEHPVLVCEVVGPDGSRRMALRVFCSRVAESVPLETCEACPRCTDIAPDVDGISAIVRCSPGRAGAALPDPASPLATHDVLGDTTPVGTILRGSTLCIGSDAAVAVLLALLTERELPEMFVVDHDGRLVGLVRDIGLARALRPTPLAGPSPLQALKAGHIDEVMSTATSVPEFESVRCALQHMANAHLRMLPIVTREGRLVGVLRDLDGLRWITANRRSER